MNNLDIIKMGLKNLLRRKTRTILTVLGVIIGTAAIVVMLSLGIGMNESFNRQVESMGSLNIIDVNPYYMPENPQMSSGAMIQEGTLDDKAVAKISQIEGVDAVSPVLQAHLKFVSGRYTSYVQLMGIDPETMGDFDYSVTEGRLLQSSDTYGIVYGSIIPQMFQDSSARGRRSGGMTYYYGGPQETEPLVDVVNDRMIMTFDMSYGERRSLGSSPSQSDNRPPKLYKVQFVGLLEQSQGQNDHYAYININQLKKMMRENARNQQSQGVRQTSSDLENYQQVMVKVSDIKKVEEVQEKIKEMGFGAHSLADIRESMQQTANTVQTVLGGIGAISLLIAALGITNTMIMSIYERTREIGIMKVLGCVLGDIRKLFLLEAGMIGFLGGVAGIAFSFAASAILNYVGSGFMSMGVRGGPERDAISVIPLWLAFTSVGFATIIGLISGFHPARRAMKLSALEAIKTE